MGWYLIIIGVRIVRRLKEKNFIVIIENYLYIYVCGIVLPDPLHTNNWTRRLIYFIHIRTRTHIHRTHMYHSLCNKPCFYPGICFQGLEDIKIEHDAVVEERLALCTFGHDTVVLQRLTKEFCEIRSVFSMYMYYKIKLQ